MLLACFEIFEFMDERELTLYGILP